MSARRTTGTLLWAVAGATVGFSILAAPTIGMFVLPFGVILAAVLARRDTPGVAGLGLLLVVVGLLTLDGVESCSGVTTSDPPRPGFPSSCEERGPGWWLVVPGAAACAAAIAALRRR